MGSTFFYQVLKVWYAYCNFPSTMASFLLPAKETPPLRTDSYCKDDIHGDVIVVVFPHKHFMLAKEFDFDLT